MRDIGRKIQRYRLSRYAPAHPGLRIGWVWLALGAWLLWAGLLSDHSFLRLWRLERENAKQRATMERMTREIQDQTRQASDPRARREEAERLLRERNGMARPGEIIYRVQGEPDDSTKR